MLGEYQVFKMHNTYNPCFKFSIQNNVFDNENDQCVSVQTWNEQVSYKFPGLCEEPAYMENQIFCIKFWKRF